MLSPAVCVEGGKCPDRSTYLQCLSPGCCVVCAPVGLHSALVAVCMAGSTCIVRWVKPMVACCPYRCPAALPAQQVVAGHSSRYMSGPWAGVLATLTARTLLE